MTLDAEETEILRELESIGARRLAERLVSVRQRGGKMRPEPWSLVRILPDGGALIRQAGPSEIGAIAEGMVWAVVWGPRPTPREEPTP